MRKDIPNDLLKLVKDKTIYQLSEDFNIPYSTLLRAFKRMKKEEALKNKVNKKKELKPLIKSGAVLVNSMTLESKEIEIIEDTDIEDNLFLLIDNKFIELDRFDFILNKTSNNTFIKKIVVHDELFNSVCDNKEVKLCNRLLIESNNAILKSQSHSINIFISDLFDINKEEHHMVFDKKYLDITYLIKTAYKKIVKNDLNVCYTNLIINTSDVVFIRIINAFNLNLKNNNNIFLRSI